jgi:hypothetical protein
MGIAELIWLAGGMKGIGEEEQSVGDETVGREHRGGSASHRPAADDEALRFELRARSINDC